MKILKKYLIFIILIYSNVFGATDVLSLSCLGDYKKLTHGIEELELYPSNPNIKIKLPDMSEYNGPVPPACHNEYGNNGQLRIITSRNKILIFELSLRNTASIFTKFVSNTAPIEVGLKRYKIAGGTFKTNLDSNLLLQFTIQKENDGHILETLNYKNIELSRYE
jgi:hypothetical protein